MTPPTASDRRVAAHIRSRQREVAEREASRLARPDDRKKTKRIGHADRSKSAVTTTPSGIYSVERSDTTDPKNTEWCGPFAVARQLIAKREEALRQQAVEEADDDVNHPLDSVMLVMEIERNRKIHPSIHWKATLEQNEDKMMSSSRSSKSMYAKRLKRAKLAAQRHRLPSLYDLCVRFLVENFDSVESLGDIASDIRTSITAELVALGKFNRQAFNVMTEEGIHALDIVDCADITQEQMCERLAVLLPQGLSCISLNQCGRCFGPQVVQTLVQAATTSSINNLSIGGAYLLKDSDAALLIETYGRNLSSLHFKACPLLQTSFTSAVSTTFAKPGHKLVELVLEDLPLSHESIALLMNGATALSSLSSLSLRRMNNLSDHLVGKLLQTAGPSLESLDLGDNLALTDATLAHVRQFCTHLNALDLSGLLHLTREGLSALFTHVVGMAPPPSLSVLRLGKCDHGTVSDDVIKLLLESSGVSNQQLGLTSLDIQGASLVTDESMEYLVKYTSGCLQDLNVSYCPQVSDNGLGYLVDNVGQQLEILSIWGNAQITDTFLDGHSRVNDSSLDIQGAWMKRCK